MRFSDQRGVGAMEFAVVAPVLLILMAAAHDVATAAAASMRLEAAVRIGAQRALAGPGDTDAIRDAIVTAAPGLSTAQVSTPALACECAGAGATCGAACPSGERRFLTLSARQTLSPLLFRRFGEASGNAVVQVR
ncbi:TadE/TadG family type IV pilus assembly protein [Roseomonas sp. CCTCC AB2023176]|uniref:TadE/TadG family type IV pilus assembly protein n=1 Tax=Roseomonas sp. CCTCC AB2023176 TaxID=3342640 RepID=UPI0035D98EB2